MEFEVRKATVEPGRSFSSEALDRLGSEMLAFVAATLISSWKEREEPPTFLDVKVTVEVTAS